MKKTNHGLVSKLLSAAFVSAMMLTALPFAGLAASAEESDGLTIQYDGYLYKKTSYNALPNETKEVKLVQYPIQVDYSGYTGELTVPATVSEDVLGFSDQYTVTEIGGAEGSFPGALENVGLSAVSLPGTVTSIGSRAFASSSLTEFTFPTSITSLAVDAFTGVNLSRLTLDVTTETALQNGTSYTTSGRATPLQLPAAVTDVKAASPLTVTGVTELSGSAAVSGKLTVAAGASLDVRGELTGSGSIQVENRGTLTLSSSSFQGQIKLAGTASSLVNHTGSPVRYVNASGNPSVVPSGETATGGQSAPDGNEGGNSGSSSRPQITVNEGGTVAVQSGGKIVVIIPFHGYHVEEVVINGLSMGDVTRYEFQKASRENTVEVTFAKGDPTEGPDLPDDDPIFVFQDVDTTAWYASAVSFMVRNKIFFGVSSNEFAPSEKTTRAMFATLLYRLDGYDEKYKVSCDSPAPLTDVRKGSWYEDASKWAVGTGVAPISGTEFHPSDVITRQEIAVYLYNFTKALGGDIEADEGILNSYSDKDKIAPEAREAMAWAATNGYLTGRSGNQLEPFSGAMRSEIAEILMRYLTANS